MKTTRTHIVVALAAAYDAGVPKGSLPVLVSAGKRTRSIGNAPDAVFAGHLATLNRIAGDKVSRALVDGDDRQFFIVHI